MHQPPNILIASRIEVAQRFIDRARRLERMGEPEEARVYFKVGRNLLKKAWIR